MKQVEGHPEQNGQPRRQNGLPTAEILLALFSFNVRIELDQLAFVGAVLLAAAGLRKIPVAWPRWARAVPAYGIGTMATFCFLQRAVSLL